MMRPDRIGWGIVVLFGGGGALFILFMREAWLLGVIWIGVALFLAVLYTVMNKRADRAEKLKREGIPGRANILEMTQTGTYVNQNPRVRLKLRIEAPGVPTFESKDTYTVPLVAMGALGSGEALPVYLDRADPSQFTIDWLGGSDGAGGSETRGRLEELAELRDAGLITDDEFSQRREKILNPI